MSNRTRTFGELHRALEAMRVASVMPGKQIDLRLIGAEGHGRVDQLDTNTSIKCHKAANWFPIGSLGSLSSSLATEGQLRFGLAIEDPDGSLVLLDGRRRFAACRRLQMPFGCLIVPDSVFSTVTIAEFIVRANATDSESRHLNDTQRAFIAAKLYDSHFRRLAEERKKAGKRTDSQVDHSGYAEAAAAVNVSVNSVRQAHAIRGDRRLISMVLRGERSLSSAVRDHRAARRLHKSRDKAIRQGAEPENAIASPEPIAQDPGYNGTDLITKLPPADIIEDDVVDLLASAPRSAPPVSLLESNERTETAQNFEVRDQMKIDFNSTETESDAKNRPTAFERWIAAWDANHRDCMHVVNSLSDLPPLSEFRCPLAILRHRDKAPSADTPYALVLVLAMVPRRGHEAFVNHLKNLPGTHKLAGLWLPVDPLP